MRLPDHLRIRFAGKPDRRRSKLSAARRTMIQLELPSTRSQRVCRLPAANLFIWLYIFLATKRILCETTSRLLLRNSSSCRDHKRLSWLQASLLLLCAAHTVAAIDQHREL